MSESGQTNQEAFGTIDSISGNLILGWAGRDSEAKTISVSLRLGDVVIASGEATTQRDDLQAIEELRHCRGFSIRFDPGWFSRLSAVPGKTRLALYCDENLVDTTEHQFFRKPTESTKKSPIFGSLDSLADGYLSGWAAHEGLSDAVSIEIMANDKVVGRVIADRERPDLFAHPRTNSTRHGFHYRLSIPTEREFWLTIRESASQTPISTAKFHSVYDKESLTFLDEQAGLEKHTTDDIASFSRLESLHLAIEKGQLQEAARLALATYQQNGQQSMHETAVAVLLAIGDFSRAFELIQSAADTVSDRIRSLYTDYLSPLWSDLEDIDYWPASRTTVGKFEHLQTLVKLDLRLDTIDGFKPENLLARALMSGKLLKTETVEQISLQLTRSPAPESLLERYQQASMFALEIWRSMVISDTSALKLLSRQRREFSSIGNSIPVIGTALENLLSNYLRVIFATAKKEDLSFLNLNHFAELYRDDEGLNSTLFNLSKKLVLADIDFLNSNYSSAFAGLQEVFSIDPHFVDWNCVYFSEICWEQIVTSEELPNELNEHLKLRLINDRANEKDCLMILKKIIKEAEQAQSSDEFYIDIKVIQRLLPQIGRHAFSQEFSNLLKAEFPKLEAYLGTIPFKAYLDPIGSISNHPRDHLNKHLVLPEFELDFLAAEITRNATLDAEDRRYEDTAVSQHRLSSEEPFSILKFCEDHLSVTQYLKDADNNCAIVDETGCFDPDGNEIDIKSWLSSVENLLILDLGHLCHPGASFPSGDQLVYENGNSKSTLLRNKTAAAAIKRLTATKNPHELLGTHRESIASVSTQPTGQLLRSGYQIKPERLINVSLPIWHYEEEEWAHAYCYQLNAGLQDAVVSINTPTISLIGNQQLLENDEAELAAFIVERNEETKLKTLLSYYRNLGVDKFYIIDNASDEFTRLQEELGADDVLFVSTPQPYSQSLYGIQWVESLIRLYRPNQWNLVVDADELLVIDSRYKDLKAMCQALEDQGKNGLHALFVDMYSKEPMRSVSFDDDIMKNCKHYDRRFYTRFTPLGGSLAKLPTFQGGVRSRVFDLESVVLNKVPLFRFEPNMRLREGVHWIEEAELNYGNALLMHFKYVDTFHEYAKVESQRGQHWNGASEYMRYSEFLTANPDYSLFDAIHSEAFEDIERFYQNLFKAF